MPARSTTVRVLLGVLLLATAGLKLYGLSASSVPRVGWFAQPWVQLLTAEWELVLGAWLLSGVQVRLLWLAALATFVAFAGVSGYLGWVGVASCGCFGTIHTSPWYVFAVDVIAISALASSRQQATLPAERLSVLFGGLKWVGGAVVVLAGLTAAGAWYAGSPAAALAQLRGESLAVLPGHLDFGEGRPGEELEATVEVRNWTDKPLRLVGGTSDCSCIVTEDLPLTVPPLSSVEVQVRLTVPAGTPGHLSRTVEFLTDCPKRPRLRFTAGVMVE